MAICSTVIAHFVPELNKDGVIYFRVVDVATMIGRYKTTPSPSQKFSLTKKRLTERAEPR